MYGFKWYGLEMCMQTMEIQRFVHKHVYIHIPPKKLSLYLFGDDVEWDYFIHVLGDMIVLAIVWLKRMKPSLLSIWLG